MQYKHGEKSAEVLKSSGFENLRFETYNGYVKYVSLKFLRAR